MAAEASQGELWEPGALAFDGVRPDRGGFVPRHRFRGRRGGSGGGFDFVLWAVPIGLAALAIPLARAGYIGAAESNRQGLFGVAFGVGLVGGGLLWFR